MLDKTVNNYHGGDAHNIGEAMVGYMGDVYDSSTSIDSVFEENPINGNIIKKDFIKTRDSLEASLWGAYSYGEATREKVVSIRNSNRVLIDSFLTKGSEDKIIYNGISNALRALRNEERAEYNSIVEELVIANLMCTDIYGISNPTSQNTEEMRQAYRINHRKFVLLGILRSHLDGIDSLETELGKATLGLYRDLEHEFPYHGNVAGVLTEVVKELNSIATAAVKAVNKSPNSNTFVKFEKHAKNIDYNELKQEIQEEQSKRSAAGFNSQTIDGILAIMN